MMKYNFQTIVELVLGLFDHTELLIQQGSCYLHRYTRPYVCACMHAHTHTGMHALIHVKSILD